MRRIEEEGAHFRSHIDGSLHLLTPERAVDIQAQLGSDIAMVLDECVGTRPGSDPGTADVTRIGMERSVAVGAAGAAATTAVASRSHIRAGRDRRHTRTGPVRHHPGRHGFALRTESVQRTIDIGFEAYAIGGLSVGEPVT